MIGLPASQLRMLRRLLAYAVRVRPDAILATFLGVLSSGIELASLACLFPLSQLAAHQAFQPTSPWFRIPTAMGLSPDAKFYATAFLALLLLRAITLGLSGLMAAHLHRNLVAHFSARGLEAYVRHLRFSDVQNTSIGHFMTIAGDDANRAAQIVSALVKLVPLLVLFLLYAVMILLQSWQVVAALALFSIVVLLCLLRVFRRSHALGRQQQEQSRALNTHFIESLSGLRTVRSFTGENFVSTRYDEMIRVYAHACFSTDALNEFSRALPTVLLAIVLLTAGLLTTPQYLTAVLPIIMVAAMMVLRLLPLSAQTLDIAQRLMADLKSAETIIELLDTVQSSRTENIIPLPALNEPIQTIEFQNVSFRYGDDTPKVLDNFSLRLAKGKSYALSGPSGAGKSTIVDLLLKFFEPQSGAIKVNDEDVAGISSESLRQHIVLAEQTTRIFYDTIEHNILFGHDAPAGAVSNTLDLVGLVDFISTLPEKDKTLLNYQGSNVSGGQRQRIGLARALLRKADVLIMDESTSALDQITRERILDSIFAMQGDRILIFIAHDPAILERVDEVIHLHSAVVDTTSGNEPAAAAQ